MVIRAASKEHLKTVLYCAVCDSIQRRRNQDKQMKGWNQLGVVETIYEEEWEFSSTSSSNSPSFSSSPASLHSRVEAWSRKTGRETDVLIRVQGTCFPLHKDRVVSQSAYLKRHLTETSDLTLCPPLNITAETFAAVAEFCYNCKVQMTPTNVAAIRTAAEMLGMTAAGDEYGREGLSHVAETYFRRVVGINEEHASMVLRSCVSLLPEVETTACLVSRCIEALISGDGEDQCVTRLNDVVEMQPQDFQTVTESINRRFRSHDVLYQMVDLYLKENKFGKLTEEEKTRICNSIDCTKLSSETLVDCVQNPRMPLRFVVRAVLVEHLNTRHSIASMDAQQHKQCEISNRERQRRFMEETSVTLGDILRRDAALRQTAQLRAAMDSTNARIQSLEKELECMNKVLLERQAEEEKNNEFSSERSASFHFVPSVENGRIERGERGSVSSSSIRFDARIMEESYGVGRSSFSPGNPKMIKTFGQRLMTGLKNAFRVPNSALSN